MADNPTEPSAPPTLGSALLTLAEARQTRVPTPARSGAAAIDELALEGGFRYGEITALAGASGTGKTLLAYHAIASHLLAHTGGEATFIDTTGAFSPVRLREVLSYRLRARYHRSSHEHSGYIYDNVVVKGERGEEWFLDEATGLLESVKVMRVFDLAGLVEAVGEVGEMREKHLGEARKDVVEEVAKRRHEVDDSEEDSDAEMLEEQFGHNGEAAELAKLENAAPVKDSGGMIIIDTVTNVASSVVSKSPIQGQALLTSFMRSLQHLTFRHQMCTILVNSAVGLNPSTNPEYHRRVDDNISIFSSSFGKPALGKVFSHSIDTSIYLSMLPKTRDDAVTAYGDSVEDRTWQKAIVLEVLKDRHGTREGRWVAFEIAGGVKLVPCLTG